MTDPSPISFGSKAETLDRLAGVLASARVLPQVRFRVDEWRRDSSAILEHLGTRSWCAAPVIVRSSAVREDLPGESSAGRFKSVAGVSGESAVREAIQAVIASYGDAAGGADQVFIQPMLRAALSGVGFSMDPNTGGPYAVISFDDATGATDTVTLGRSNRIRTVYASRHRRPDLQAPLDRVYELLLELEGVLACAAVDIEFAVDQAGELYLLQARPLRVPSAGVSTGEHRRALESIESKIRQMGLPHPYLKGSRTVFGVMPDWNPAEILGARPRPLALSLYRELITDGVWAYQRDNYGYRNLRSFPLLLSLCGLPYVDVRVDFNSFLPRGLDPDLTERLVDYYTTRLIETPSFHDKVEFEIVFSCYTFDLPGRMRGLEAHGFSPADTAALQESLRILTNRIVHPREGLWLRDTERIAQLDARRRAIASSGRDLVSRIYWLLEDCTRFGTLPFAGLARAAFIATQLLRSLEAVGVFRVDECQAFMGSLETVGSRLARDFSSLPRDAFLERYGHLRPGTYDILSPRYDEAPDRYFDWPARPAPASSAAFDPSPGQMREIERLLGEHRLELDAAGLLDFIRRAIEAREQSKFLFTQSLSLALTLWGELGAQCGLTPDDCSYTDISILRQLYASSADVSVLLHTSAEAGRRAFEITRHITLPPLLTDPRQVWAFELPPSEPNFITQKIASGPVVFSDAGGHQFAGSILLIPSADPGYDWIFARGIAGLITLYGGANSHMAVRAGELSIPAVIGAGEQLYERWSAARVLEIDAANRQVRIIR